jgi:phosphopantothenoylcysteine synthetase/decarboxylase
MPREIIIGVSGGIAAYKTAALVSELVQGGMGVSVVMTSNACKFVGPTTFRALSGRNVAVQMFAQDAAEDQQFPLGSHIELARRAELLCVAPASANLIAQAAHGMADNLLSTLLLSFMGPVLLAPAMNCDMWSKPSVQRNISQLGQDGVEIIGPTDGWLSCRDQGKGRMAEPAAIKDAILARLENLSAEPSAVDSEGAANQ